MAKKKKRKEPSKKKNSYSVELRGLILILFAVIGFGRFGIVGEMVSAFAAFLVGTWYNVLLAMLLIVGIYMMVKREAPNFFTSKLFGLYVFIIGILVLSHLNYVTDTTLKGFDMVKETIDNFMLSIKNIDIIQGGGIIGALFTLLNISLFDVKGTDIVIVVLLICGVVMFTGVSIMDALGKIKEKGKKVLQSYKLSRDKRIQNAARKDSDINLFDLFQRDKGICWLCGEKCNYQDKELKVSENGRKYMATGPDYPSIDHIIPLSKGGLHIWENVKLAHKKCNIKKSNKLLLTAT